MFIQLNQLCYNRNTSGVNAARNLQSCKTAFTSEEAGGKKMVLSPSCDSMFETNYKNTLIVKTNNLEIRKKETCTPTHAPQCLPLGDPTMTTEASKRKALSHIHMCTWGPSHHADSNTGPQNPTTPTPLYSLCIHSSVFPSSVLMLTILHMCDDMHILTCV